MFCSTCGTSLPPGQGACPACASSGVASSADVAAETQVSGFSTRDKGVLILLASLLGGFGADRFYRGQIGLGVLKLVTFGACGVWTTVDLILYCVSPPPTDAEGRLILDRRTVEHLRGR